MKNKVTVIFCSLIVVTSAAAAILSTFFAFRGSQHALLYVVLAFANLATFAIYIRRLDDALRPDRDE